MITRRPTKNRKREAEAAQPTPHWDVLMREQLEESDMPRADRALAGKLADAVFALEHPEFGGSLSDKVTNALEDWHRAWVLRATRKSDDIARTVESLDPALYKRSRKSASKKPDPRETAYSLAARLYGVSESTVIRAHSAYLEKSRKK